MTVATTLYPRACHRIVTVRALPDGRHQVEVRCPACGTVTSPLRGSATADVVARHEARHAALLDCRHPTLRRYR
jgi:hypothetical protein